MRLLQLKPQIRQNWTALAVGHHLQGEPARAVQILAAFEDTLKVLHLLSTIIDARLHHHGTIKNILKHYYIVIHFLPNTISPLHWNISMTSKTLSAHQASSTNSKPIICRD